MGASPTATATAANSRTALPIHRLDVATYDKMVASGALDGERVELLDGVLVEMSPHSPAHAAVITTAMRHLAPAPQWWTRVQLPIATSEHCEPEPDIAVLAQKPPAGEHPTTALLVIEVAVSSQQIDRDVKARLYASAGIPAYWLIDVPARSVEVYTDPGKDTYRCCKLYESSTKLPCGLEGVADITLTALFGDV